MSTHTATVVNGQLQLDVPLPLPDNSRVTVTVAPVVADSQQAWASLKERLRERPVYAEGQHFTRDELHERH
jgi:hypothetical protein